MKPRFKVGDKVRILDGSKIENYAGGWYSTMKKYIDKVFTVDSVHPWWGIDKTHAYVLEGCDFVWDERGLELVDDKYIKITTHGKKVVVKVIEGDKVVKTGVAKCSPEDEFDFETGAKIAFERLFDDEIKVDDMVKVTDTTKCYACNVRWVAEHVEDKILIARYAYGKPLKPCDDNGSFRVLLIADNKAYISSTDDFDKACYLVDLDALEKL